MSAYDIAAELIARFEGLYLKAYRCPAGVWTIGYGSTRDVRDGMEITMDEAFARLMNDMQDAGEAVQDFVEVDLNDNQFAALVSFVFNVGTGAFRSSTLLQRLNSGDYAGAAQQFSRWTKAKGVDLPGLVRRRAAERALFEKG